MSPIVTAAALLSGLGLFFLGVRALSANLVLLVGRRARAAFARALQGPVSCAISGFVAGLATQSTSAVSWIIVSFTRGGVVPAGPALIAPMWSNVGTALLPMIVAVDLSVAAGIMIGIAGFASYFKLARTDRLRTTLEALLGAALLLFGMHLIDAGVEPLRDELMATAFWQTALDSPWLLALIGGGFSLLAQSSSVAAAIAVAAVGSGLLDLHAALPLLAGANAAAIVNNGLLIPNESSAGRIVFALQCVMKAVGSLLLLALAAASDASPAYVDEIIAGFGGSASAQTAVTFVLVQVVAGVITTFLDRPTRAVLGRILREDPAETLAQPAFLLHEALGDPTIALDSAMRELARLSERLPLLLDGVRDEPDGGAPKPAVLRAAGASLSAAIKTYIAELLDHQPTRPQVATALLLEDAATNAAALHEALADFAASAPQAKSLPTAARLVEALHVLMSAVAEHAGTFGADDPQMVLALLGQRGQLMEELRQRLSASSDAPPAVQDALFRMTILFERIIWLAGRLVSETSQAQRAIAGD